MLAEEKRWGNPDSLLFDRAVLDSAHSHMEAYRVSTYDFFFDPGLLLPFPFSGTAVLHALSFQSGPLMTEFRKGLKAREAEPEGGSKPLSVPESDALRTRRTTTTSPEGAGYVSFVQISFPVSAQIFRDLLCFVFSD